MPFMEFLRGRVTMTETEQYTQQEIRTPVSKTEELAMLIHQVQLKIPYPPVDENAIRENMIALQDRSATEILEMDDPSSIMWHLTFTSHTAITGLLYWVPEIARWYFNPPILYARDTIWLAIDSTCPTAFPVGLCQIGYTLERVSSKDFIAALIP